MVLVLGPAAPACAHGVSDTADLHLAQNFAGTNRPVMYPATLSVDRDGAHELDMSAGEERARVPCRVLVPTVASWIPVGARPGPPAPLAWAVRLLPLAALLPLGGYMWTRARPGRQRETWTWS